MLIYLVNKKLNKFINIKKLKLNIDFLSIKKIKEKTLACKSKI